MKKQKYVLSALAALTILTSAVGFSTFADEVPENSDTVIETVIEDEETQQTDEQTEEETSEDSIIDNMIKSAKKKIRSFSKETNFTKHSGKKCRPARQKTSEGEVTAEENSFVKPEKKSGRHGKKSAEQTVDENITEETTEE